MHVLLVEDHTDTRSVLAMLLNRCGCQTVIAKNLKEGRSRLAEMRFDVLITDLTLPDGDGLELARLAKASSGARAIAVTGRVSAEERELGLAAGFDSYLTKPLDFLQLRQALRGEEATPK